jgi:microcystin-dependent protein
MKKTYLILCFLAAFFSVKNVNAQANVQATGISIQGIARDENNSAVANVDALGLAFKIYYLDGSNNEVTILNQTGNVKTDNFGVFSYVMNIDNSIFTAISNTPAYLKVTQGSVVFSNEKLQAVPYAIHAQNGVPSGTIMAYVGTTPPVGWLLCDGSSFPDNVYYAQLKALLGGTNTPNLAARYLRGVGVQEGRGGIALKGTQYDELRQHAHGVNITTTTNGNHEHNAGNGFNKLSRADNRYWVLWGSTSSATPSNPENAPQGRTNAYDNANLPFAGDHTHQVIGNTISAGSNDGTYGDTRPYSYGVNWIIKI